MIEILPQIHQGQMVSLVNSFKHSGKKRYQTYISVFQNGRWGNTLQCVLWGQLDPGTKSDKVIKKKKKKIKTPVVSNWPPSLLSFPLPQQADTLPALGGGKGRTGWLVGDIIRLCTVPNWTRKLMQPHVTFFRFLQHLDRSQKSVKKCKIRDLEDKPLDLLSKHYCQMP